jgi:hypothetical protein
MRIIQKTRCARAFWIILLPGRVVVRRAGVVGSGDDAESRRHGRPEAHAPQSHAGTRRNRPSIHEHASDGRYVGFRKATLDRVVALAAEHSSILSPWPCTQHSTPVIQALTQGFGQTLRSLGTVSLPLHVADKRDDELEWHPRVERDWVGRDLPTQVHANSVHVGLGHDDAPIGTKRQHDSAILQVSTRNAADDPRQIVEQRRVDVVLWLLPDGRQARPITVNPTQREHLECPENLAPPIQAERLPRQGNQLTHPTKNICTHNHASFQNGLILSNASLANQLGRVNGAKSVLCNGHFFKRTQNLKWHCKNHRV